MPLKLPDFLRPTCTLPFLEPFFDPVMIIRLIGLLQIKIPIPASKCMVANKCHAYVEKWVYSLYTVHNSIISGIQLPQFKFGSIYISILKLIDFILLIYFYLVFCFCVKLLKKFQLFLRQNSISIICSCLP